MVAYNNFFKGGSYTPQFDYSRGFDGATIATPKAPTESSGNGFSLSGGNAIDAIMEGLDAESAALTNKLKSIYNSYQSGLDTFNGNIEPIIGNIQDQLVGLNDFTQGYDQLLSEMRPDFIGAIRVDPSAAQLREEYVGNVAAQFDNADASNRRALASQGVNPYANNGAVRENKLARAGAIAGASNQAYRDYIDQRNSSVAQQQQADAAFAGLYGKKGDLISTAIQGNAAVANIHSGILDNTLKAQQAKADGYEGLSGQVDARRTEALNLNATKQAAKQQSFSNALAGFNSSNKSPRTVSQGGGVRF